MTTGLFVLHDLGDADAGAPWRQESTVVLPVEAPDLPGHGPSHAPIGGNYEVVSGGFFVFQKEIFDYLNDDPDLLLEHAPLQSLARDNQLAVYVHEGYWEPMDTYRDYLHLNNLWREGEPPWKLWPDL